MIKYCFLGYGSYLLTIGRKYKWARLTLTKNRYFMLVIGGIMAMISPLFF